MKSDLCPNNLSTRIHIEQLSNPHETGVIQALDPMTHAYPQVQYMCINILVLYGIMTRCD